MSAIIDRIEKTGIIPVVVLHEIEKARPVAEALLKGNLPIAEIMFRTDAASDAIQIFSEEYPEILVGAGTVLTTGQAKRAIDAGAKFIVSPGFDSEIVHFCQEKQIHVFPGVMTPTEIMMALNLDLEVLKFFPSEYAGGLAMIEAIASAFHDLRFIPTGGINIHNLAAYLNSPKVLACAGSWPVAEELIEAGDFETIEKLCQETAALIKHIRS